MVLEDPDGLEGGGFCCAACLPGLCRRHKRLGLCNHGLPAIWRRHGLCSVGGGGAWRLYVSFVCISRSIFGESQAQRRRYTPTTSNCSSYTHTRTGETKEKSSQRCRRLVADGVGPWLYFFTVNLPSCPSWLPRCCRCQARMHCRASVKVCKAKAMWPPSLQA